MRRLFQGVIVPMGLLAYVVYIRGANEGTKRWHPWQVTWDLWLAAVVVTSMMVGAGLYSYWRMGGWRTDTRLRRREPFDHDDVQRAADLGITSKDANY